MDKINEAATNKQNPIKSFLGKLGIGRGGRGIFQQQTTKSVTPMRPPKIGLALGCGGAPALIHIGVLKVLEDHDIPVHSIAGCSMGAYIGALWATGMTADEMIAIVADFHHEKAFKKLADPVVPPIKGLFYGNKFREHLEKKIGTPRIEELDREFIAIAANIENYQRVVFNKGDLLSAVHASCAMPGIVVPVNVKGIRCVDGGVVDPVPVGALRDYTQADRLIAVSTTPSLSDIESAEPTLAAEEVIVEEEQSWLKSKINVLGKKYNPAAKGNMLDTLRRSLKASQIRLAQESCKRAHLTIHPITEAGKWDDFENYEHFIAAGAKSALDMIDEIKALTEPVSDEASFKQQVKER